MKKYALVAFLAGLVLMVVCMCAAAAEQLPAGIWDTFSDDTKIESSASWEDPGRGTAWFVLVKDSGGINTLYCFGQKNGSWVKKFATSKAVPQGKNSVGMYISEYMEDNQTGKYFAGPILAIWQADEDNEYTEFYSAYQLSSSGQWNLIRIWSLTGYGSMEIGKDSITYYRDVEDARVEGTVKGTFQRDLRYVSLAAVPKTYKQAKQKLTSAPTLPEGSGLTATEIQFTGGKKYEVYSAPDKKSIRGGNGKAKVSTNGWIQVFGKENGWILIQYSIDSSHYRFGYIDAASLPKKAEVADLYFDRTEVTVDHPVSVTDDPLYSQSALTTLAGGESVTWLTTMGSWAYIEGTNFRGFVPVDVLSVPDSAGGDYETYTGEDGEQYDLFEIRKLFYDRNHQVYAVSGVYERVAEDEDCYYGKTAENAVFTYDFAPDIRIMMVNTETWDLSDPFVPVTDLYAWYIDAYMCGEEPESGDIVFLYDLPEDERETAQPDFWFLTTRIRLNEQNQIEYLEYYYVPWG